MRDEKLRRHNLERLSVCLGKLRKVSLVSSHEHRQHETQRKLRGSRVMQNKEYDQSKVEE